MKQTLEAQVAHALLQKTTEIQVGNTTYQVAPPSIATLVLVSEAVAKLPHLKLNDTDVVRESLAIAKDCRALGDILAILILGAKTIKERTTRPKKRFLGLFCTQKATDPVAELAEELLETLTPSEMHSLVTQLLAGMDLGDFFAVTTFLTEINLLRQTKVESATTAFGQ